MSRTDVVDEETLRDDEYYSESINSDDLTTRLKNQALSFARQVMFIFQLFFLFYQISSYKSSNTYLCNYCSE